MYFLADRFFNPVFWPVAVSVLKTSKPEPASLMADRFELAGQFMTDPVGSCIKESNFSRESSSPNNILIDEAFTFKMVKETSDLQCCALRPVNLSGKLRS